VTTNYAPVNGVAGQLEWPAVIAYFLEQMARWLVRSPGAEPTGPVDASDLRAAWTRREIPPDTMVCAEGYSHWVQFHEVAELVAPPAPTRVAPPAVMPRWLGSLLVLLVLFGVGVLVLIGVVGVHVANTPRNTVSILPCSR
jgi:uncharacterized protein DUF4339